MRFAKPLLVALLCIAGGVYATNYSLWINGRSSNAQPGNHADFSYWGPSSTAAGVNKKSVNWDGFNRVSDQNYRIRDELPDAPVELTAPHGDFVPDSDLLTDDSLRTHGGLTEDSLQEGKGRERKGVNQNLSAAPPKTDEIEPATAEVPGSAAPIPAGDDPSPISGELLPELIGRPAPSTR